MKNSYFNMMLYIFGQQAYRLHMHRMSKLVHGPDPLQLIPSVAQNPQIPGQGGAVAADVDDAIGLHAEHGVQTGSVTALSRWVHYDHVRMA